MIDVLRLVLEVLTNLCFVPGLVPLAQHRRHFSLFVGITQTLAALAYCFGDFFQLESVFIPTQSWHFVSDVLSLTYGCLLIIHLCAFEDEERGMVLRYLAFFASWVFKYRDAWDSIYWEVLLVLGFLLVLAHAHWARPERRKRIRTDRLQRGAVFAGVGLVGLLLHLRVNDSHKILMGLAHCGAGLAVFELWNVLPPPAKDKRLQDAGGAFV